MKPNKPFPDPAQAHAMLDEADIGSGEKTPGEQETDEIVSELVKREKDDVPREAAED
ncbi:MAG TPA: hypothetical protein VGE60_11135 [Telluria sp.]